MNNVAYIMSRFPKLTETFVLYEILALKELGIQSEIHPLWRVHQAMQHPEVERLMPQAHFRPFLSMRILRAHAHFLRRRPGRYFRTLAEILQGTFGNARFFFGALAAFPKTVGMAHDFQYSNIGHVHAHFATHAALAAFVVHRLTGISFSFTAHGSDLHMDKRMLKEKTEAADFVVTVSDYNRGEILRACGEWAGEKVHVIHCGADLRQFSPPAPEVRPGFHIACVASLEEVKGHTYLLQACKVLRSTGVEFVCHLIGDGPLRRQLEGQVRHSGLDKQVVFHGPLPRAGVVERLHQSDVFVLPSVPTRDGKREGIPVALMEAMACGLPVVSSKLSGIPELVEDGRSGILVEPRNSELLGRSLLNLYRSPGLRAEYGRAGREKVLREFDLSANAATLAGLLRPRLASETEPLTSVRRDMAAARREAEPIPEADGVLS